MKKRAVYPGSFDPPTIGHQIIIDKSLAIFDELVIAVGVNCLKKPFFPIEKRMELMQKLYGNHPAVEIVSYEGLTADFCREENVHFIIRGIRNVSDFEFERNMAQINKRLNEHVETIFMITPVEYIEISSGIVREVIVNHGDPSQFLPLGITADDLK